MQDDPLDVLICWPHFSGYMAACWKALARVPGIRLRIIAFDNNPSSGAVFDADLLNGLNITLLSKKDGFDAKRVEAVARSASADVLVVPGWFNPAYRRLVDLPEFRGSQRLMCMDNPWLGTFRQRLARIRHRGFLRKIDRVIVPGERAYQFALRLGFSPSSVATGLYGFDPGVSAGSQAKTLEERKTFLYLGRYSSEKGIDTLLEAYDAYRESHEHPWRLMCCGGGPLKERLQNRAGVEDAGFVQPHDLPEVFQSSSCLVLPSHFEPWGVVIGEAATNGLPVLCSKACGASVEIVRHLHNGYLFGSGSVQELSEALAWAHGQGEKLSLAGDRSRAMAAPFTTAAWAERWARIFCSPRIQAPS